MRAIGGLLLFVLLFYGQCANSQTHDTSSQFKDSIHGSVPNNKAIIIERRNDSANAARIKEYVQKNGKSLDAYLAEIAEQKAAEKRRKYIRIFFATLFFAVLIISFLQRRKGKN